MTDTPHALEVDELWAKVKELILEDGATEEDYNTMVHTAAENLKYAVDHPHQCTEEDHKKVAEWICEAPELAVVINSGDE